MNRVDHDPLFDPLPLLPRELRALASRLEGVIPGREEDFISLGCWLQQTTTAVQEFSRDVSGLSRLITGGEVRDVRDNLAGESFVPVAVSDGETGLKLENDLELIAGCLVDLEGILSDFDRVVRHLKALQVSTRIESARLGEAGSAFTTLADDVGELTRSIVRATGSMAGRRKMLAHLLATVSRSVAQIANVHRVCMEEASGRLQNSLHELRDYMDQAEEVSLAVSRSMQEIANSSGEIVAGLQFQDITRQQMEHVVQALRDAADLVGDRVQSGTEEGNPAEVAAWVAEICRLQERQVANGRDRLVGAVESILDNIHRVAGNVKGISVRMTRELGPGQTAGKTVLSQTEEAIAEVARCMEDCAVQGESMGRAMHDFASLVGDMTAYADQIEEVGSSIELISLNASVRAAHVHERGAALGVLAVAIQGLAVQAAGLGREAAVRLTRMAQAAKKLEAAATRLMDVTPVRDMLARHTASMQSLQIVNRKVQERNRELAFLGGRQASAIMTRASSTGFHRRIEQELGNLVQSIGDVAASLEVHVPEEVDAVLPEALQKIFDRYTMDAERDVHHFDTGLPVPGEGVEGPSDDSGFGDNVELF